MCVCDTNPIEIISAVIFGFSAGLLYYRRLQELLIVRKRRMHNLKLLKQMKTSACRDGILKNQPNKMGMTPQHIFTPSCHFANYALCLLVVCIAELWKAVGRVLLGAYCMLMCMESVYFVGGCNVVACEGMFLVGCCSWL